MALNAKQRQFIAEYLVDRNATKAYMRAGYKCSEETARRMASRLMTNDDIKAEIERLTRKQAISVEWTAEEILRDIKNIATDPTVMPKDRLKAYELGGKRLAMWVEKVEHSGTINNKIDFTHINSEDLKNYVKSRGLR